MITLRKAEQRGREDFGWLDSRHTFSFGSYFDPEHMGFRTLRVINEDRVAPGGGFPTHAHRDAEILSYVLEGALEHKDSMGNGSVLRPGEVQRMTAGTGVTHSELNPSSTEPLHFLQIWLYPGRRGLTPSYEQKHFDADSRHNRLLLVASNDGRDGSVTVHQDVALYTATLDAGTSIEHDVAPSRHVWVQMIRGRARLQDEVLQPGDGVALSEVSALRLEALEPSELLVFDLA